MAVAAARDKDGNVLADVHFVAEPDLDRWQRRLPIPASLVVVRFDGSVLMVFSGWRQQWELPGGIREPGETTRQAAVRELAGETGIRSVELEFVAVAEVDLRRPCRREYTALYRPICTTPPSWS